MMWRMRCADIACTALQRARMAETTHSPQSEPMMKAVKRAARSVRHLGQSAVSLSPSRYAISSSEILKSTSAFSTMRDGVVVLGNGSTSFSRR